MKTPTGLVCGQGHCSRKYLLVFQTEERQNGALSSRARRRWRAEGTRVPLPLSHGTLTQIPGSALLTGDLLNTIILDLKSQHVWFGETHVGDGRNPAVPLWSEQTWNWSSSSNSKTSPINFRLSHIECSDFWIIRGSEWNFLIANTVSWKVTYSIVMPRTVSATVRRMLSLRCVCRIYADSLFFLYVTHTSLP